MEKEQASNVNFSNDENGCTLDSCDPATGNCRHVNLCPRPAINDVPTLAAHWTVSGFVDIFATRDMIVVQWTADPGWTAKIFNLFLSPTKPDKLPPANDFPYRYASPLGLTFAEIVVPLSDFEHATCDSSFFISLQVETVGDPSVRCGVNYETGKKDNCQGARDSWMLAESTTSKDVWGSLFTFSTFCCCFDATQQFTDVHHKKISVGKTLNVQNEKEAKAFVIKTLARLLAVPAHSIRVSKETQKLGSGDNESFRMLVEFGRSELASASTALSVLTTLDPVHFEHLGAKDFTLMDVSALDLKSTEWENSGSTHTVAFSFYFLLTVLFL